MKILRAHGKLLISAEYMVMHGSGALAIPLQPGQSLQRIKSENPRVFSWKAVYKDQTWFTALLDPSTLAILDSSDPEKAQWLQKVIRGCIGLFPAFQEELFKWDAETHLDFSPRWGLGSSSSVIALLADWAEVNPLDLHFLVSEGSGYDVACAISNGPILYRIREGAPRYQHVPFNPSFSNHIYFAWLGTKQPTAAHLRQVADTFQPNFEDIHRFSKLTEAMIETEDLMTFRDLIEEHEDALSKLLKIERISISRFPELPGSVKSLGAWGGDFVMIVTEANEKDLFSYLYEKRIQVIYRYHDLVYNGTEVQESTST